jgi:hypothetical protein
MIRQTFLALTSLAVTGCSFVTEQSAHDMLMAGDPAVCAADGMVDNAIGVISKEYKAAIEEGMPSFPAEQVTATGINKDIHEVNCQAKIPNLSFLFNQGAIIKYTLRPSLESEGEVSIHVQFDAWVPVAIQTDVTEWREASRQEDRPTKAEGVGAALDGGIVPSAPDSSFGEGFERFPADIYQGPSAPLRLSSGQKMFVTRIKEAYPSEVDFGGSLVMLQIGCGTGCTFAYALDKSSGTVLDFPVGGEDYQYLTIRTRENSALAWAGWQSSFDPKECRAQAWVLGKNGFQEQVNEHVIDCAVLDL